MESLAGATDHEETFQVSDKHVKADLKGDRLNFCMLLALYILQGFPMGLTTTIPIILQSRNMANYEQQALFSIVAWPFTLKILWAPFVDSLYVQRIGRRKSWLLPLQYSVGSMICFMAYKIDDWLPKSGEANLTMIVLVIFTINFMSATQDIVVDGWGLTVLKKHNVSYASMCNAIGFPIGMFMGSVCMTLLTSEDFNNKYFRTTPAEGGLITFQNFLFLWSIVFLIITTFVGIFKKEKDCRLEDGYVKINVIQNYKLMWNILKKPRIRVLITALLTARVGYCAMDSVSNLKLVDAGLPKDDIMITSTGMYVVKFILPIFVSNFVSGLKPMSYYMKITPIRLSWSLMYVMLIYYTPSLLYNNGVLEVPIYYYFIFGLIYVINEMLSCFMLLVLFAFFCRISDPRFGGTYMTLFNTFYFLGWFLPNTLVLKFVAMLTFKNCSNDIQNNCSSVILTQICKTNQGSCKIYVDGYYITVSVCIVIGLVWYYTFKNILIKYESVEYSKWSIKV